MKIKKTNLSIVIPLYNEAENIKALFKELNKLKNKLPKNTEVIFVNDGSKDQTVEILLREKLVFKKKVISLSKNFGHQSALIAGLNNSTGEIVITMDGDLQHPPKIIPNLIKLNKQGYDIVLTQKIDNHITKGFKKTSSILFYKIINLFSNTRIYESASDFRLMNRKSLHELLKLPESSKFLRGLVSWIGFKTIIYPFEVESRAFGTSKYSLGKMFSLAVSGISSFSTFPLFITGFMGLLLSILSFLYAIYVFYKFFTGETVSGWTSLQLITLLIGSFTFISLGIIGVYLSKIYEEVKKRPEYIISDIHIK